MSSQPWAADWEHIVGLDLVPFSGIAAVEYQADGPCRVLAVSGRAGRLLVRYSEDGQTGAEEWIRRLRLRAAPVPAAVPFVCPGGQDPRAGPDLDALLLDPADEIVWAGWRSRARRVECLLTATSREVIIVQTLTGCVRRRRGIRRTLYLPRRSLAAVAAMPTPGQASRAACKRQPGGVARRGRPAAFARRRAAKIREAARPHRVTCRKLTR